MLEKNNEFMRLTNFIITCAVELKLIKLTLNR